MRAAHATYTRKGVKEEAKEPKASQSEGMDIEPMLGSTSSQKAERQEIKGKLISRVLFKSISVPKCCG